jgi:hypothetical protein
MTIFVFQTLNQRQQPIALGPESRKIGVIRLLFDLYLGDITHRKQRLQRPSEGCEGAEYSEKALGRLEVPSTSDRVHFASLVMENLTRESTKCVREWPSEQATMLKANPLDHLIRSP